jgi:hypothetical protein
MRKLLKIIFVVFAFASATAYSAEGKYDGLLKSAEDKNSDTGVEVANGIIDGERYTIRLTRGSRNFNSSMVILVDRKGRHQVIRRAELEDSINPYSASIRSNSIFIRYDTVHHGLYFTQYQFRKINDVFYLVGMEWQSIAPSVYGTSQEERDDPNYQEVEMWAGTSVNFLTSKAECWQQNFNLENGENSPEWKEWESACSEFDNGRRATKGVKRQIGFPKRKLVSLDEFSFYGESYTPFTCYFDHKYKFHGK